MSWSVKDRWGNVIALTDERWRHIVEGHWELTDFLDQVLETIRLGTRKQHPVDPDKYRYSKRFSDLPHGYTHIFVLVRLAPNKFVITAYPKRVR
jgi:hypothetical protein